MMDNSYDYSVHYRAFHPDTDEHAHAMAQWHAGELKPFLPQPSENLKILDVGCGMGHALLGLTRLGYPYVEGIDIDPKQIEACKRMNLRVCKVENSADFLNSRKEYYDVVILFDVLEHIAVSEQIETMRYVYQSLRIGGRVVLKVPNASALFAARWRYIDYTHCTSFTQCSLEFVLKNAGFERIEIAQDAVLVKRPALRLWRKDNRRQWLLWLLRSFWKICFELEFAFDKNPHRCFDLDLRAVGYK